jgi:competence protein ComEC
MLLIACALLGAMRYSSVLPTDDPQAISNFIGHTSVTIRGTVVDEPKLQGRLRVLLIDAQSISRDGGKSWQDVHGHFNAQSVGALIEDPYAANYGDSVELKGKLQPPTGPHTPDIFASMAFPRITVMQNGGNIVLAYFYHLRVSLATLITQALPQPEAALLIALVLSLRTATLESSVHSFNVTGTAHLIAASGFKVTIVAGLVANSKLWLYEIPNTKKRPKRLLPAQQRRDWRLWLTTGLVIAFICIYTILSGLVPAALRAGIMGIILVTAPLFGRKYNVYTALALATLALSVLDPFVLWDVGFLLSFLGTLGIILFTRFFQRLLRPLERFPFASYFTDIVAVTLAAEVATLPIFAIAFQQITLSGWLLSAN